MIETQHYEVGELVDVLLWKSTGEEVWRMGRVRSFDSHHYLVEICGAEWTGHVSIYNDNVIRPRILERLAEIE